MNHKRIMMMSIVLATLMLVSLFAVVSSASSASATTMAGTGPVVSSSNNGPWYIFAVNTSGTLWYTPYGNSSTWNSLGGVCTASPAAVSWGNTLRFDVFVRGSDGALWHIYSNDGGSTWSNWESLGGQLAPGTGPAVASWSQGRLDVFVQGTDNQLWHKWWNSAGWSGWESLGGKLTASPAATWDMAVTPANNIYVFVRGSDGAVWQKYYQNGWSSWKSLGGQVAPNTGPAVSQVLNLFVQGTDHQLWLNSGPRVAPAWRTLSTTPPEALSTSSPGAVLLPNDHTLVCVSSTSGNVWYYEVGISGQWYSAGSPP
jgi:hypothetical protein